MTTAIQETSKAAEASILPSARTLRETIYDLLVSRGTEGATDEELQIPTGMNGSTERPRRGELVTAGRVVDSNLLRLTKSGREAVVWVAL